MILLNDQDIFPTQVRAITDGDPANAAYTNMAPQDLADRTRFLYNTITQGGLTREGATRIRSVADVVELGALTGMAEGDLCKVGLLGIYVYSEVPMAPEPPWIVPCNTVPGTVWVHTLYLLRTQPLGIVTRDADGRLPAALPKNGVVAIETAKGSVLTTAKGGDDWLVVDGLSMAVDVLEGDIVDVDVSLNVGLGGTLVHGWVCLAVDGTPPVPLDASKADVTVETRTRVSTCTRFEATAAGTISLVTAIKADSATNTDTITAVGDAVMRATVYRP